MSVPLSSGIEITRRRHCEINFVVVAFAHGETHTPLFKMEKGLKNPPWNPILWWCKLAICLTSWSKIGFGELRPSEIWQPWHAIFGNPENQIADLQVFELPQQEYGIRFDFQGCHLFENSTISSHMGTLKMKIFSKYQKYAKNITYHPNFVTGC